MQFPPTKTYIYLKFPIILMSKHTERLITHQKTTQSKKKYNSGKKTTFKQRNESTRRRIHPRFCPTLTKRTYAIICLEKYEKVYGGKNSKKAAKSENQHCRVGSSVFVPSERFVTADWDFSDFSFLFLSFFLFESRAFLLFCVCVCGSVCVCV